MTSLLLTTDDPDQLEFGVWQFGEDFLNLVRERRPLYWSLAGDVRKLPASVMLNAVSEWDDHVRACQMIGKPLPLPSGAARIRWDQAQVTPNQTAALRLPPLTRPTQDPRPALPTLTD